MKMGKIERFLAKPKEVEIAGEKFTFTPLTVQDLPLITKMGNENPDVSATAIKELVYKYMKIVDPEATEEQLKSVSMEFLQDIMGAIGKVNNLDMGEAKKKLLEDVKKRG